MTLQRYVSMAVDGIR